MKISTAIVIFLTSSALMAQRGYTPKGGRYGEKKTRYRSSSTMLKRNATDVFPIDRDFRLSGWYAALGITYMVPMKKGNGNESVTANNTTTTYVFEGKPGGKIGPYIAIGYFHAIQNPTWFHFWDIGMSYRQYTGKEYFNGLKTVRSDVTGQSLPYPTIQTSNYTEHAASLIVSLSNHRHFSRYGFIQNSFGLNADYFFSKSRPGGPTYFPGYVPEFHDDFQVQMHYRIGVGWKATPTLLVIPSLELPLVTTWPFENGKSSLEYFSTRQYPVILSIRFMLLRPISEDCNVPNYDGPPGIQN